MLKIEKPSIYNQLIDTEADSQGSAYAVDKAIWGKVPFQFQKIKIG